MKVNVSVTDARALSVALLLATTAPVTSCGGEHQPMHPPGAGATGGGAGAGGGTPAGGGGPGACAPEAVESCFEGPAEALGVGNCVAGLRTCQSDGTWGPCAGQVLPIEETCATIEDDDCDGQVNEAGAGCACTPGSNAPCYNGPPGTLGEGICAAGTQTCNQEGLGFGPCLGSVGPGTEDCAAPADEDCNGIAESCTGAALWSRAFGGAAELPSHLDGVSGIAVSDTTVLTTGQVVGIVDFGGGATPPSQYNDPDLFVARFDAATGEHAFSKRYPEGGGDAVLPHGAGGYLLVGRNNSVQDLGLNQSIPHGVFVARFLPGGDLVWISGFGGQAAVSNARMTPSGRVVVGGSTLGPLTLPDGGTVTGGGGNDVLVVSLDEQGGVLWARAAGDEAEQYLYGIAPLGEDVVLAGSFLGALDLGCAPLSNPASGIASDVFLARLDAAGACVWAKAFGDDKYQQANAVAVDAFQRIWVAGVFEGTIDLGGATYTAAQGSGMSAFVACFEQDGTHVWSYATGTYAWPTEISVDGWGNVLAAGSFVGELSFGGPPVSAQNQSSFLVKLTPAGEQVWLRSFAEGPNFATVAAIATDAAGRIYLGGSFKGLLDLGSGTHASNGYADDAFLAALQP